MPSSDEMFGQLPESMFPSIAQKPGEPLPAGMFPNIVAKGYGHDPDPEEFDKEMEKIRYDKILELKDVQIHTFDFSKQDDVEKYRKLYSELYPKIQGGAIVFHCHERMQINDPNNPRWVLHMEYSEYMLTKIDITEPPQTEGTGKEKDDEPGERPIP